MAWLPITNKTGWEYNNAPVDPTGNPQKHALWLKSVAGIRTQPDGTEVYVMARRIGTSSIFTNEISKSYWDAR